jgi:hypothetical protein
MGSEDVLGFLGRTLHPSLAKEVVTDAKRRPEGWRIRHRMGPNWVKVYDKASVLRVETVINNAPEFKILRVVTDDEGKRSRRWCPMRKGVSDLWRGYQVGIASNRRYLDALAAAPMKGKGASALDALCPPKTTGGRRVARFSPLSPTDLALFRDGRRARHLGVPKQRPHPPPLSTAAHRPGRSPPTLRTRLTAHRETPWPRSRRQGSPRPPLPCHALRPTRDDCGAHHPRRQLPAALSRARCIAEPFLSLASRKSCRVSLTAARRDPAPTPNRRDEGDPPRITGCHPSRPSLPAMRMPPPRRGPAR